jgi:ABC-type sugar transport system ATPase subunit
MKAKGVSFMFVSHSIPQVRKICEKTVGYWHYPLDRI